VPDAAITTALENCDLALIGAETIGADGSCYNTVGSLSVALACDYWRVPLYVPSTLIKIDTRTLFGYQRPMPPLDQHRLSPLTADWPATLRSRAKVLSPDLDCVPPAFIAAYITEVGVIPPSQIATHAARLAEALPHD
jgi:ribose 1,5-bisphosphate isomerase